MYHSVLIVSDYFIEEIIKYYYSRKNKVQGILLLVDDLSQKIVQKDIKNVKRSKVSSLFLYP